MKRVRNFLIYAAVLCAALMFFAPKVNLYYQAEHALKPYGVIISDEHPIDRGFWLDVEEAKLYVQQIESAKATETRLMLFGFYNQVEIRDVELASALQQFVPASIERILIRYTVLDPLHVTLEASGDFGTATARFSVTERTLLAEIAPSKLMTSRFGHTLRTLKKNEAGGYLYESRF